jgi:hypothetical protein
MSLSRGMATVYEDTVRVTGPFVDAFLQLDGGWIIACRRTQHGRAPCGCCHHVCRGPCRFGGTAIQVMMTSAAKARYEVVNTQVGAW